MKFLTAFAHCSDPAFGNTLGNNSPVIVKNRIISALDLTALLSLIGQESVQTGAPVMKTLHMPLNFRPGP